MVSVTTQIEIFIETNGSNLLENDWMIDMRKAGEPTGQNAGFKR